MSALKQCYSLLRVLSDLLFVFLALQQLAFNVSAAETPATPSLTFEKDIRPILKENCFDCHGEGEKLKGGLDTRLRRSLARGGETGPALVPGDPEHSLMIELLEKGEMPKREKKLSPLQLKLIRQWIAEGARTARPEPNELAPGIHISEEDRNHWAFQAIRSPAIPAAKSEERVRTPIDAFIARDLRLRGLKFSPDADRVTLIRRVFQDLLGFPPSPEEVTAFVADSSPQAYEQLIDRLLQMPQYGERWGRHWLDVAGYADSDGYTNDDNERPYAYKFRDYVIQSLNRDKPINQFLTEQLAGDELALLQYPNLQAAARDPTGRELLAATGYLRMAADGTASSGVDQDAARNQVVTDTIRIVSTSLLGLSVGCAQCHDHRYDPIPQTDFYRLRALFEPAYDWKNWRKPGERLLSLYSEAERKRATEVEAEAQKLSKERETKQKEFIEAALAKHLEKFEPAQRTLLSEAFHTPADKRTPEQKKLLADNPSVNIHPGVLYQYDPKAADSLKAMDAKISEARSRRPPEDFLAILTENTGNAGALPVTYRFHRGDPKQPKEAIGPGWLTVLSDESSREPEIKPAGSSSGRRLAFAQWLTDGKNPLFARVLVNRVWLHHFGRGLVGTPANFGLQGERPTHPELLDWLSYTFTADHEKDPAGMNWSLKSLHRLILSSTVYRQSTLADPAHTAGDGENRLYGRRPIQRLDAESVRDSILRVAGTLNFKMNGSPVPIKEDAFGQVVVGIEKKEGDNKMPVEVPLGGEEHRRSVYIQVRRSKPVALLTAFDAPAMEVNCEQRQQSTVAPQALMLMNSDFILRQAGLMVARLKQEAPRAAWILAKRRTPPAPDAPTAVKREWSDALDEITERAWQLAYSRSPSKTERNRATAFFAEQFAQLKHGSPASLPTGSAPATSGPARADAGKTNPTTPVDQALANLCQVLLSSNEFLYTD